MKPWDSNINLKAQPGLHKPQSESAAGIGWFLAVSSVVSTCIVSPLARNVIVGGMHPAFLLLVRLALTVFLLFATFAIISPKRLRMPRRGLLSVMVIGLIGGFEICSFFLSLAWLDSSMASMLKTTQPLAVLLLLRLGGEPLTLRHGIRLLLAIGGVYLLVGPGGRVEPFGLLMITISVILYALQIVFTQWYLREYDSSSVTIYMLTMMTVVVAAWWWFEEIAWYNPDRTGWITIIVLAVVSTYYARLALYAAVPRIGSGQISLLWPLQMFLAVIVSVIWLNEQLTPTQWFGGCLILTSALLAIKKTRRNP